MLEINGNMFVSRLLLDKLLSRAKIKGKIYKSIMKNIALHLVKIIKGKFSKNPDSF